MSTKLLLWITITLYVFTWQTIEAIKTKSNEICSTSQISRIRYSIETMENILSQCEDGAFAGAHMGGHRIIHCQYCETPLTNRSEILSTRFTGATGRAFLFNRVVNIVHSDIQDRVMLTGRHLVRDVVCIKCNTKLGWMYEHAMEESQRYKEGKVILERALIMETEGLADPLGEEQRPQSLNTTVNRQNYRTTSNSNKNATSPVATISSSLVLSISEESNKVSTTDSRVQTSDDNMQSVLYTANDINSPSDTPPKLPPRMVTSNNGNILIPKKSQVPEKVEKVSTSHLNTPTEQQQDEMGMDDFCSRSASPFVNQPIKTYFSNSTEPVIPVKLNDDDTMEKPTYPSTKLSTQVQEPEIAKESMDSSHEQHTFRIVKPVNPAVYRRFMEQRMADIGRIHRERKERRDRLESEMSKVGLDENARVQMRCLLRKKESNHMRMQRAKMDQSMFYRIKHLGK
ncbi:putative yippee protein [Schistosoma mansoni]|nr:putative yippee protein [Schistosoma mansoni]|eukprot:XP_018654269.1 putative yippee protein [Schistosoma mansoni]